MATMSINVWQEVEFIVDMRRVELSGDVVDWNKSSVSYAKRRAKEFGIDWNFDPDEFDVETEAKRVAEILEAKLTTS